MGQWVLIRHSSPGQGEPRFTYKAVEAVEKGLVTVRVQELVGEPKRRDGEPFQAFAQVTPLAYPPEPTWEEVEVGGIALRCFRLERLLQAGGGIETWTSYDVPVVFGLYVFVRQVTLDAGGAEVRRSELLSFGTAADAHDF